MTQDAPVRTGQLILVPAIVSLAVTLLRLVGELQGWSPVFFSRAAGGGGAIVGISWLVLVFGAWFGWKLAKAGAGPAGVGRGLGLTLLALVILPVLGVVASRLKLDPLGRGTLVIYVVGSVAALAVGLQAWPALGRTLLAYAFAARIPVALLMLAAIYGNWGTHYDVAPPNLPAMGPLLKWFYIGFLPQFTIWIAFTVVVGSLFGIVAGAIARRGRTAA
jgi:hypothetical protein